MHPFIIILLLAILASIISIYLSRSDISPKNISPKDIYATGLVMVNHGKVETTLKYDKNSKDQLYALALLYASKIKWLTFSEPPITLEIFRNVFKKTLDDWPTVPKVEMIATLDKKEQIYKVDLCKVHKKWFILNQLPNGYSGDLVTNYFFLLEAIVNELGTTEKVELGKLLNRYKEDCSVLISKNKSVLAFMSEGRKINKILSSN